MKNFLLFFACLIFTAGQAQNLFQHLPGHWECDAFGGKLYTSWAAQYDGSYYGHGVFLDGADTTYRETLRLFQLEGKWLLLATPENNDPFIFEAKTMTANEVVFENKNYRNPKKVLYRLEPDGTFYRRTEGENADGTAATNEYFFKKIGAPAAVSLAIPKPAEMLVEKSGAPAKATDDEPLIDLSGLDAESVRLAVMLAPQVISTAAPEFASTVSPDGKLLLFNRTNADRSQVYLMQSRWENGAWSQPELVPFTDTTYRDVDPFFTPDGNYLFFSSNRPRSGTQSSDFNVWTVKKTPTGWGQPHVFGSTVNTEYDEIFTSLTREGHLYFTRMGDDLRKIVRCEFSNKNYLTGVNQALPIGDARVGNPAISPDETFLVFMADGGNFPTYGGPDLYLSWRNADGAWSEPQNLGELVNSAYVEFAPAISPDGKWLYFTSERPGVVGDFAEGERRPGDLYRIYLPPILEKLRR